MMSNPPGIVASLLPAPEQAILNANLEKSFATLYRPDDDDAGMVVGLPAAHTTSKKESFAGARAHLKVEDAADSAEEIESEDNENGEVDDDDEEESDEEE